MVGIRQPANQGPPETWSLLQLARFYRLKGLSPIPIKPRAKEPNSRLLGMAYVTDENGKATLKPFFTRQANALELTTWFKDMTPERTGIGIVAGVGNLVIIDIDREEYFGLLFQTRPEDLGTWVAKTSKGYHVYLTMSQSPIENVEIPGAIELKVRNKYVVSPPSIHPSGIQYRWVTDIEKIPIRILSPEEGNPLIEKLKFYKKHWPVINELAKVWKAEHRHNLSLWFSGFARKQGISEVDAARIIESVCVIAGDSEIENRLGSVKDTYQKKLDDIAGVSKLQEELASMVGSDRAGEIVTRTAVEEGRSSLSGWAPSQEDLPELMKPLTFDDVSEILETTVKRDTPTKIILFASMLLTYTDQEQVNVLMAGESSIGKSYLVLEIALYFPEEDVMTLGGASPTSFFHEMSGGGLATYDLEKKLTRVDLSKRILIFLDQPHDQLLQKLRPLLSHDRKELMHKISDRSQKAGLRTKTIVLVGYPTVIFCTARLELDQQERTRVFQLSPETGVEKIEEAKALLLRRKSDRETFSQELLSNRSRKLLLLRVRDIRTATIRDVVIDPELQEHISRNWKETHPYPIPRHIRDLDRLLSLVKASALLSWRLRTSAGEGRIKATLEDVDQAFKYYSNIAEANELGLAPQVYEIFQRVILPSGTRQSPDNRTLVVGVSRQEILKSYFRVYHRPLSEKRLTKDILPALDASGLISEEKDPEDGRRMLVYPQVEGNISPGGNSPLGKPLGNMPSEVGVRKLEERADGVLENVPLLHPEVSRKEGSGQSPPSSQFEGPLQQHALHKLRVVRGPMSWDYALEKVEKITKDESTAQAYLKGLAATGMFSKGPDGYWRLNELEAREAAPAELEEILLGNPNLHHSFLESSTSSSTDAVVEWRDHND